jgi:hypothetical protein
MKRVPGTIADCRGHCLLASMSGTSPPPGSNPAGARLPTALPRILAGANEGTLRTCFARQFLLAPKLRCLWSHPAGLLPGGYRKRQRRFPLIQEYEFNV